MCLWWATDYSLHTETVQVWWIWGRKIQETDDFCDRVWLVYRPNDIVPTIDSPPKKPLARLLMNQLGELWGTKSDVILVYSLMLAPWHWLDVRMIAPRRAPVSLVDEIAVFFGFYIGGYTWVRILLQKKYIYIYCFLMPQSKTCWGICRVSKPSRLNSFHHFSTFWMVKPLDKPIPLFGPL